MNIAAMNDHELTSVFTALIQDIHAMRAELNRLEIIAQDLKSLLSEEPHESV